MATEFERVKKVLVEHLGVDEAKVTLQASIADNLGADSLDFVELVMAFEEEFGVAIKDDDAERCTTVADVVALMIGFSPSSPDPPSRMYGATDMREEQGQKHTTDDGGPAFPCPKFWPTDGDPNHDGIPRGGMSLRDYFAAAAMAAFIQRIPENRIIAGMTDEDIMAEDFLARCAYDQADAMVRTRAASAKATSQPTAAHGEEK